METAKKAYLSIGCVALLLLIAGCTGPSTPAETPSQSTVGSNSPTPQDDEMATAVSPGTDVPEDEASEANFNTSTDLSDAVLYTTQVDGDYQLRYADNQTGIVNETDAIGIYETRMQSQNYSQDAVVSIQTTALLYTNETAASDGVDHIHTEYNQTSSETIVNSTTIGTHHEFTISGDSYDTTVVVVQNSNLVYVVLVQGSNPAPTAIDVAQTQKLQIDIMW